MTYYIQNVKSFRVTDNINATVHDKLPVGTYIINQDMHGNFYLDQIESFEQPSKIYGNTLQNVDRILNTFLDRTASTGVMLAGEKGSGKSLLAKTLSTEAQKQGISTIVINRPWVGDGFNKLMQDIDQPVVVLFDEFEKVYDSDEQEQILTLFDGMFPTKKLFVLTCNDKWRVDKHMRNRPGRIYYMMEFSGLGADFVEEYCQENLKNKDHIESVVTLGSLFDEFNFDMLKAMVEEMNRYSETAQEVMALLNTKPEYSSRSEYEVAAFVNGKVIEAQDLSDETWHGNPLNNRLNIAYFDRSAADEDDHNWHSLEVSNHDLRSADGRSGQFVFENGGVRIVLTRKREKAFDYGLLA